ncbi:MAG: aminopeptidase, partial [Anaerolineales bacterium]|nr:aminopeptidase [Anaerolineales bacterium]
MADSRVSKFADVLVQHSARVTPGDRVLIEATTAAEPLVRELYIKILEKGGHPVPLLQLPDMFIPGHEDLLIMKGNDAQLDYAPPLHKLAYDNFESRIRIHSTTNTRSQSNMDASRSQRRGKAVSAITEAQMRRGAEGIFKWVTTLYPTEAYAQEAGMSLQEYEDFVFGSVHAQEEDPIKFWKSVEQDQQKAVDFMKGKNQVVLRGPNVDLTLSVKGRAFMNSYGTYNMPDGEIYTGP